MSGASCIGGTLRGSTLEPRYVTVHNAFQAMGMAEVGALHDGRLVEGQEARIDVDLASGCTTLVALGGGTIADLDASLLNTAGTRIARGISHASDATIRACIAAPGSYTLVVKSAHGAGDFIVSTWSGGAPSELVASGAHESDAVAVRGSCEAPLPLSAGDFPGSTTHGESRNESKGCHGGGGREIVYKLDVPSRQKVTVSVEVQSDHFDSILYMRKAECGDAEAEVTCNDDAPDPRHSKIEEVVDAGVYYVFVDGYRDEHQGSFKMHVELADVPALAEVCQSAPLLAEGTPSNGSTEGTFNEATSTCGEDAHGPDTVYRFDVPKRSRVRFVEQSDDFAPVVHVRSQCLDPSSGIGCSDTGIADHEAAFLGILDPGSYAVFADSSQHDASGKFTMTAETSPELGSGVRGERCGDAIPLSKAELVVNGDTFAARDDVSGTCGGTGAPDVVYRLDAVARTRFTAHVTKEEGTHVLVLLRGCTGQNMQIECGKSIDRVLAAGAYFLAVDGSSPASFGKFTLEWVGRDTQAADTACRAPSTLREDHIVSGTTVGGVDKFSPSCAAHEEINGAPDAVYKLVVPTHQHVRLDLSTSGWGSVLTLRRSCLDSDPSAANTGEVECRVEDSQGIELDATLDPGTYFVVVDGREAGSAGTFTLQYHVVR